MSGGADNLVVRIRATKRTLPAIFIDQSFLMKLSLQGRHTLFVVVFVMASGYGTPYEQESYSSLVCQTPPQTACSAIAIMASTR